MAKPGTAEAYKGAPPDPPPFSDFGDFYRRLLEHPIQGAPYTPPFRPVEQAGPEPPVSKPEPKAAKDRDRLARNLRALGG